MKAPSRHATALAASDLGRRYTATLSEALQKDVAKHVALRPNSTYVSIPPDHPLWKEAAGLQRAPILPG